TRYKQLAIAISAALTAMAGTFYAQYVLFIDPPSVLPLSLSIQICLVVVLGGAGTLVGPLLGAAVLVPLSAATSVPVGGSGRSLPSGCPPSARRLPIEIATKRGSAPRSRAARADSRRIAAVSCIESRSPRSLR